MAPESEEKDGAGSAGSAETPRKQMSSARAIWQNAAYTRQGNRPVMRVRIEDVAEVAGVSMKTVSRVLNQEP
ncbi:LacI family DNA-binding transcriptional regulator, partial [Xanthomonas citri pv. citri]